MTYSRGNDRLFVYGTLHPDTAPPEIADVVTRMTSVGRGTIHGIRYELDSFPAVVVNARKTGNVDGEVYILPEDPEALKRLDEYEEYYPQDIAASLFRRERTTVTLHDGSRERCWVYIYNQPISSNRPSGKPAASETAHRVNR